MSFEDLTEIVRRYDVMDYLNYENVQQEDNESSINEYYSDDGNEIDYVDFSINGEDDIMITNLTIQDDFLNRLCSTSGLFRCFVTTPDSSLPNLSEDDLDASTIDPQFKVKRCVVYLVFNPDIPWNQFYG
uniref:Uncharacterized protein n=1 Tax=Tanacetum cinerariifolium TaxID=118510 RepID=A0A6L2L915_TANCI|nr:hypothetical protein [Tanacetum cinerariifolium]